MIGIAKAHRPQVEENAVRQVSRAERDAGALALDEPARKHPPSGVDRNEPLALQRRAVRGRGGGRIPQLGHLERIDLQLSLSALSGWATVAKYGADETLKALTAMADAGRRYEWQSELRDDLKRHLKAKDDLKCPRCHGSGIGGTGYVDGIDDPVQLECPECGGAGVRDVAA